MKYVIYDNVAERYISEIMSNSFETKEAADEMVAYMERSKFVKHGRFVVHSFDDTLNDQYIISESGNPTKVVDNITVDLSGTVNVKYGTMISHWSTISLNDAIDRMNALQKAVSAIYTSWNNTFDIYKVITIMDEKEHTHYQFINVTAEGLEKYSKDEEEKLLVVGKELTDITDPLNKRIEKLEKANYELGEQVAERGAVANRLLDENNSLKAKVEAIKKEARNWKELYKNADTDRVKLKNAIDIIYSDLKLAPAYCDKSYRLKAALQAFKRDDVLSRISMPTEVYYIVNNSTYLTAKDEICAIIDQILTIMESRELNQSVAFSAAKDVKFARDIANDIISICEADDKFEVTLKKFSELYETIWIPGTSDDVIAHAFKSILFIFSTLENEVRKIIDKDIANRDSLAEVIFAIRNAICNSDSDAFRCIENRMKIDKDFNSDSFMAGVRENIKDICAAEKKNISNHELKNSEIARLAAEKDKALERAEKFKWIANSVYGMIIPGRCYGKQMTADVITGKKILVDKEKYDDLMECVNNISLTYEMMKLTPFSMDRPSWLSGIINRINNLTK